MLYARCLFQGCGSNYVSYKYPLFLLIPPNRSKYGKSLESGKYEYRKKSVDIYSNICVGRVGSLQAAQNIFKLHFAEFIWIFVWVNHFAATKGNLQKWHN